MSAQKHLSIIELPCAVSMPGRTVEFSRDGRDRGIWIWLREEKGEERNQELIGNALDQFLDFLKIKKGTKRFGAGLRFYSLFQHLLQPKEEAVLLEWEAWDKAMSKIRSAEWQHVAKEQLKNKPRKKRKARKKKS